MTAPSRPRNRRSLRLRLTALYSVLFLLSGAVLLALTYLLVFHPADGVLATGGRDGGSVIGPRDGRPTDAELWLESDGLTEEQLRAQADRLEVQARRQQTADRHRFLIRSAIALVVLGVLSVVVGWVVAGRLLRPLRTINDRAREISAASLHERLSLNGPDDELKRLGDTIDALLARLEASFQSQRQFVANASHELRTPLARQRTLGQLALSDPEATIDSLRAAHERVLAAGRQQERLIESLLTLTRSEGGLDRRELFDLADVTALIVHARHPEAEQRTLRVTKTLGRAPVRGDPRLVEHLIGNLVDNALRHNAAPGWVEVTTDSSLGRATLSVANTGPVIPESEISRLFQPFQRLGTDRTHHDTGLGLGLSIVRAIATAHDADITAQPHPAGGLRITVTFPGGHA
ncbi:HAMP domain-containing histidine kinase [Streptomyces sp. 8K308]|uniref:sensor histidine kinase n=1 Tax=Streptomyces sp. 8K308 TaxID=2530388 RepID=UPI00104322D9|nr:HAMP domain-containing sensor histidine kinase [Streptomyces sp. 8K308]TDC23413.1 HAMP domain-containing histidine kinase [Streptomyces sp. 8K308]